MEIHLTCFIQASVSIKIRVRKSHCLVNHHSSMEQGIMGSEGGDNPFCRGILSSVETV